MANSKETAKKQYKHFVQSVPEKSDWFKGFNFLLIESMQDLEDSFKNFEDGKTFIALDTETSDLDPENLELVGYSYCMDGKNAYYVPINHFNYGHNLGEEAVAYIYDKMCRARQVFMYNVKFDARVFEYRGFKELSEEDKKKRFMFVRYDMSKVKLFDVMIPCWLSDTNVKMPSLKMCLSEDTFVKTTNGDKYIQDVKVGDFVVLGDTSFKVLDNMYKGIKPLLELEFEDGSIVKCTEDHQFLVRGSLGLFWVMAKDLTEDMDIVESKDITKEDIKFLLEGRA